MNFSEKVQKLRKDKNISQEDLAEIMNVSRQAVSKWESGQSMPDIYKLVEISNYFKVSIDYLLKDENEVLQKSALEIKEVSSNNNLLKPRTKRIVMGSLSGICIYVCLHALLVVDQIRSKYQAVMIVIYSIVGITASIFGLLKIKKQKNG